MSGDMVNASREFYDKQNGKDKQICTCINCKTDFVRWERTFECEHCEEGYYECDWYEDGGSGYAKCKHCNGTGQNTEFEYCFCSEDCLEDLTNVN